jgi:hypothetical protein
LADAYTHRRYLEGIVNLVLRDRFAGNHSARRASSAQIGRYRHIPVVEIDSMGIGRERSFLALSGFGLAHVTHYGQPITGGGGLR